MPSLNLTGGGGADPAVLEEFGLRLSELEAMGGTGSFRGEYVGAVRLHGETLALPLSDAWSFSQGVPAHGSVVPMDLSANIGNTKPPEYSGSLLLTRQSGSGTLPGAVEAFLDLSKIPALQGRSVTEVRYYSSKHKSWFGGAFFGLSVDGTLAYTEADIAYSTVFPWVQHRAPVVASGQSKLSWLIRPKDSNSPDARYGITGIEIFGTPEPYMYDHYAIHNAQMWRSTLDNNPHEPGSGVGWEPVALADLQDVDGRLDSLDSTVSDLVQRLAALEGGSA